MHEYNQDLESWRVVSAEDQLALVNKGLAEGRPVWEVVGIYLSHAALAVHLRPSSEGQASQGDLGDEEKESLAHILRQIRFLAEGAGVARPLVAVLEVKPQDEVELRRWSSDQDWSHGDFILEAVNQEKVEMVLSRFLAGNVVKGARTLALRPLTLDGFLKRFREELKGGKDQEHDKLLQALLKAWETGMPPGALVQDWLDQQQQEIESLLGGGERGGQ